MFERCDRRPASRRPPDRGEAGAAWQGARPARARARERVCLLNIAGEKKHCFVPACGSCVVRDAVRWEAGWWARSLARCGCNSPHALAGIHMVSVWPGARAPTFPWAAHSPLLLGGSLRAGPCTFSFVITPSPVLRPPQDSTTVSSTRDTRYRGLASARDPASHRRGPAPGLGRQALSRG